MVKTIQSFLLENQTYKIILFFGNLNAFKKKTFSDSLRINDRCQMALIVPTFEKSDRIFVLVISGRKKY